MFYKANAGYVDNSIAGSLTDLSQVTFLDINKYINFLPGNPSAIATTSGVDFYDSMKEIIGDNVDRIYGVTRNNDTYTSSQSLKEFFPSTVLMFPKTDEYLSSNSRNDTYTVIHLTTLNKLIVTRHSYSYIYDVSGNKCTHLTEFSSGFYRFGVEDTVDRGSGIIIFFSGDNFDESSSQIGINWRVATLYYYADKRFELTSISTRPEIVNIFKDYSDPDVIISDDPYGPGGNSGEGDLPPGTFDDTSDPIPDPPLPTLSASDTGFTRIYNPTLSQVRALARYLWTEPSILETIWNHIKQFFEDPMQAIIGFNLVPCRVPDGGTKSFALMFIDTGVQMTAAANQFVDVDCGTFALERYYGSALDQNPYTKVSCFLPYIGTVHLNTDEVMGTTLQVKYRIDIVSGSCVAKILVDGSALYQYSGHCAITIPISAADFSSYVSAAIGVGTALAGLAVGAAAGAAAGAASSAGIVQSTGIAVASESTALASTESSVPAVIGPHEFAAQQLAYMSANQPPSGGGTQASFAGLNPENIVNTVDQVMGGKMQVEHSGSFSGNSGYLGVRRPYLIIERPNMCLPATYGQLNGYPSMITLNLGECQGFTRVQQVQLTGCTATNPEQSEILQFLKSGVIL